MSSSRRTLEWGFLGRVDYASAVALQEAVRDEVRTGRGREALLLLEHPHVYTLGRNASAADVVADPAALAARGVEVTQSNRGGKVTYHGPGQLVGYPVVNLDPDRRDLRRYVGDLLEVLVRTLADFGVAAAAERQDPRIGVWVGERKIASIGVHVARWIATHGFALNVATDLSYFEGIVACGLGGVEMASIERLTGRRPPLAAVAGSAAQHFAAVFGRDLAPLVPGRVERSLGSARLGAATPAR